MTSINMIYHAFKSKVLGKLTRLSIAFSVMLAAAAPATAVVIRQPYIQSVTETSVVIVWRTGLSSPTDSRVEYGTTQGSLNQNATATAIVPASNGSVRDHIVPITGLTAGTKYFYNIGTTSGGVEGGGTSEHYFTTAPATGSSTPFSVWVVGDSGDNSSSTDQIAVRDAMLAVTAGNPPDLFLHAGDIAYNNATDQELTDFHFARYATILQHTPFWPSIGNHEVGDSDSGTQTGPYFEGFVLPTAAEAGGFASNTEAYYSFDYANVHFIVLDSADSSLSPGSAMLNWVVQDLSSTLQYWVIVMFHHPPYSKGTHNSDNAGDSGGRMVNMRENVMPLLEAGGVDLVLSGHSHVYERSYLIDGAYGYGSNPNFVTPNFATLQSNGHIKDAGDGQSGGDGAYTKSPGINANEGTVYLVTGAGGRSVSCSHGCNHPVMFFSEAEFGSVVLTINGETLTAQSIRDDQSIADHFTIMKGIPSAPAAPSGLSAVTATASRIDVSWIDNANNETGVEVERSINGVGGPFVSVTTVPANSTSYADTNLLPDLEYCYRARAVNPGGTSGYSNVDCDTTLSAPAGIGFSAYNDCAALNGTVPTTNITVITTDVGGNTLPSSGELIDFDTGAGTGVTFSMTGGEFDGSGHVTNPNRGPQTLPDAGTDAGDVFNGIIDTRGAVSNGGIGTPPIVMTFTGMDPNTSYTLAFFGNRDFHPERTMEATILDIDAFTNESSVGTVFNLNTTQNDPLFDSPSDPSTLINADNTSSGLGTPAYLVKFTNVNPGSDGDMVLSIDDAGADYSDNRGRYANAIMLQAEGGPTTPPADPTTLTAVTVATTEIELNWIDNADNEAGFEIQHSSTGAGGPFIPLATVGPDVTTFLATNLVADTEFCFRVRAVNGGGPSNFTNVDCDTTGVVPPPADPTNLVATTFSHSRIDLTWTDNANNEAGFEIEVSTDGAGGPFTLRTTVGPNTTAFSDTGLPPETEHCYRVRAINFGGESLYTNVDCDTTDVAPPSVLICEDFESGFTLGQELRVHPEWFYEDTASGPIPTAGIGVTGSVGLSAGNRIFTWVQHPFDYTDGDFAGIDLQMDFQANGDGEFNDDRMGWMISETDDSSDNILGVQIEPGGPGVIIEGYWDVAADGDDAGRPEIVSVGAVSANGWYRLFAQIRKLGPTSISIDVTLTELDGSGNPLGVVANGSIADTNLLPPAERPMAKYFTNPVWPAYKNFSATGFENAAADNACFEIITTAPVSPPAAPTNLIATAASSSQINLTWTDNANNENAFQVERSTTGVGGPFSLHDTLGADATSYEDTDLDPETEYCYRVRATNLAGPSVYSNVACDTTPPAPTSVEICEDFESGFTLNADIGTHAEWFTEGSGPLVESGIGTGNPASIGLDPGSNIFTWIAHPFDWNASDFVGVKLRIDFETNGSGLLDDDRAGFMITDQNVSSTNIFGVQVDPTGDLDNAPAGDLRLEGYWDAAGAADVRPMLDEVDSLSPNTWYRLAVEITKLTATSASVSATVTELDTNGNPTGGPVMQGTIADTSTLGADAPDSKYFTALTVWPAYKNHTGATGDADNTCVEIIKNVPTPPTNLVATAAGSSQIGLSWNDNSSNETDFEIERSTNGPGGPFSLLDTVAANVTSYPDTGLDAATEYCYRVRAVNLVGPSGYSNVDCDTTGAPSVLNPGDVIIAGFQAWNAVSGQNPAESIELFNTTDQTISLETLQVISRTDNDANGSLDVDWQLADESPNLSGKTIAPYSFFLIAEAGVAAPSGFHDIGVDMDLATGEGGFEERAIGIELIIEGVHMDHVLYGRHDGNDTGANPDGDLAFGGFPRDEVIRNTLNTNSFQEGVVRRLSVDALHAGHAVNGFYTDEASLPGSNPPGVWTCPHDNSDGSYVMRNSLSAAVPPPVCSAPTIVSAESVLTHISVGDFGTALGVAPASGATENRLGGPKKIVITFDKDVTPADGTLDGNEVVVSTTPASGGLIVNNVQIVGGDTIEIDLTGVNDRTCLQVVLDGIACDNGGGSPGDTMATVTLQQRVVLGDTGDSGRTTSADVNQTAGQIAVTVDGSSFRNDINTDGAISAADVNQIKANTNGTTTVCP